VTPLPPQLRDAADGQATPHGVQIGTNAKTYLSEFAAICLIVRQVRCDMAPQANGR
jgi:hypothetical protein